MRTDILLIHVLYLLASVGCFVAPFQRLRLRASWSRWALLIVGVLLVGMGAIGLASDFHVPLAEEAHSRGFYGGLSMIRGVVVGLLVALLLSGELVGKKVFGNEARA